MTAYVLTVVGSAHNPRPGARGVHKYVLYHRILRWIDLMGKKEASWHCSCCNKSTHAQKVLQLRMNTQCVSFLDHLFQGTKTLRVFIKSKYLPVNQAVRYVFNRHVHVRSTVCTILFIVRSIHNSYPIPARANKSVQHERVHFIIPAMDTDRRWCQK